MPIAEAFACEMFPRTARGCFHPNIVSAEDEVGDDAIDR